MNGKFFDGAELFKLYAENGLPLEMALMRIDQAGRTVDWPLFVQEAVRNGWSFKKAYITVVSGVRDAEIYTKAQMVEFETITKLFFMREAIREHPTSNT
jgi:alanyl-tRNA synthetase